MSQVVTFSDYIPSPRFDGNPWTDARVDEATSPAGPWSTIDTLTLDPVDADPEHPASRDLTTENASDLPNLWYRIVFLDATGDHSQATVPVQNTVAAPTADAERPCGTWITAEDVIGCCDAATGSDLSLYEQAAEQAVELLFELSGRRFTGVCERTVRPCPGRCGCWPLALPGRVDPLWNGLYWHGIGVASGHGCRPLSSVKLAGYPVRDIIDVHIDGDSIDPTSYRIDRGRDLVRLNDSSGNRQYWPGCQDLGAADGPGTFFVTYTYGRNAPPSAVQAARQLACELAKACPAEAGTDPGGDCDLPAGTVRVTRQGLTIEAQTLGLFLASGQTGLAHVDAFLAVHQARGRRPSVVWSPDITPYAQEA